jgi:3'-5' exoribonuclease
MPRRPIEQFRDGDVFDDVFLAAEKQVRVNKNGNPYLQLELRDRTGGITARMWNAGEAHARLFENGDFVNVEGKIQAFQGALQAIVTSIEKAEAKSVDLAEFMPRSEQDIGKMTERLRGALLKLGNPHLRAIAECFLMDDAFLRGFTTCPAGVKLHHAYIGGLLEHVLTMMDIAEKLVPFYPGVDRDLVMMGIFLHDLGKTRELTYARAFGYTDEGQLLGHINIGVEMLIEQAAKAPQLTGEPVPRELMVRLKHMILSHHGSLDYGSPKVPMTPEAMLLHAIDLMDTRMHQTLREIKDDRANATAWTPYNPTLQRRFYKGGPHGDLMTAGGEAMD